MCSFVHYRFCFQASKEDDRSDVKEVLDKLAKACSVVLEICKSYKENGGADNLKFCSVASDMTAFMGLAPVVHMSFPLFIKKRCFEMKALSFMGSDFWNFIQTSTLPERYGLGPDPADVVDIQEKLVSEKVVDITKTSEQATQRLRKLFDVVPSLTVLPRIAEGVQHLRIVLFKEKFEPEVIEKALTACRDKSQVVANAISLYPSGREFMKQAHAHMEMVRESKAVMGNISKLAGELGADQIKVFCEVANVTELLHKVIAVDKEIDAVSQGLGSQEAEKTFAKRFADIYEAIFQGVASNIKGMIVKLVDDKCVPQDAPGVPSVLALLDALRDMKAWRNAPWAVVSHEGDYDVCLRVLLVVTAYTQGELGTHALVKEEIEGMMAHLNVVSRYTLQDIAPLMGGDTECAKVLDFLFKVVLPSDDSASLIGRAAKTIEAQTTVILDAFKDVPFAEVQFHDDARFQEDLVAKLIGLPAIDSMAWEDVSALATRTGDRTLREQINVLQSLSDFLGPCASLAQFVHGCGMGLDRRDKLAVSDTPAKLIRDARAATAALEASLMKIADKNLDALFNINPQHNHIHINVFSEVLGKQVDKVVKALLNSSREVQKLLSDQWAEDVDGLTKALHRFCPHWQAKEAELLTNKDLQITLLTNPTYANISPAVEMLKASAKFLKASANLSKSGSLHLLL